MAPSYTSCIGSRESHPAGDAASFSQANHIPRGIQAPKTTLPRASSPVAGPDYLNQWETDFPRFWNCLPTCLTNDE